MEDLLTKTTTIHNQNKSTKRTPIPAIVRDILRLENKDTLIWELNPKKLEVTIRKEE